MDQGELEGMPEPAVLRLHTSDGQVLVTWGRVLVYRYEADDIGMRNLAIVALTDAGRRVDEVAAVFGLTATYVSILRGRARTHGSGPGRGHRQAAAGSAPHRVPGQTVAAFHPPRRGAHRAPAWLPGRVLLPVQPSPLTQPRSGLLPGAPTGHRPRPSPLPAAHCALQAEDGPVGPSRKPRPPA